MKKKFWEGKTLIITGASSGIGEALYKILLPLARKIYILQRREASFDPSGKTRFLSTDFSSPNSLEDSITAILQEEREGIDVLFNNAGITAHGRLDATRMEVFRKTLEINFFSPVRLTQAMTPLLLKKKGIVVSVSTVSSLYGVPGRSAYSASKSALQAAMEAYRIEMIDAGIRSIIVCPPYTRTALRTSGLDADGSILSEPQAGDKIKTPEEVALSIIQAVENPDSRLVTIDTSGLAMKVLRLFAPSLLEKIMYRKLYKDFH